MTNKRKQRSLWYLAPVGLLALVLTAAALAVDAPRRPIDWVIRGAAVLGYQMVFLAIISSAYVVRLVRLFGRPFVQLHHVVSVTGLVLITLHPLGVAWRAASASVFVPDVSSLRVFLLLGGRPAWYLIVAAALVAVLRRRVGPPWRSIHMLNYIAFVLVTVHANMMSGSFLHVAPKVLSILMAVAIIAVFVQKRVRARRPAGRKG